MAQRNSRSSGRLWLNIVVVLCLALLIWVVVSALNSAPSAAPQQNTLSNHSQTATEALAQLGELDTVPGRSSVKYQRNLFGPSWSDVDNNGCDTRNDILQRDLVDVTFRDGRDCKVASGTLHDSYSATTVSFVSGPETSRYVQIDHIVPLSWAWHHGADTWSDHTRELFANDPNNLIATIDTMNQAKGDSGPSRWLPDNQAAYCDYAESFVAVLSSWQLGVNGEDREALAAILVDCD